MHASSQNQRPAAQRHPQLPTGTQGHLSAASWPGLGRRLQATLRSGSENRGAGPRGPRDARPCEAGWISRDRSPGNLTRAAGDLGGPVLGLDLARVLRARSRASLLGGPPAPQALTLRSCAPSRDSLLGAGVVGVAGRREEPVGVRAGAVEGGRMGWSLKRGGPCAVPRPPPALAHLWSRGHDGHVWRRCHPGWRGPRALPALQSELRCHGQGGWALRPALGTPQPALRVTPSPRPLP